MGLYFEEFEVGQSFTSPGRTITEADLVAFAGLTGDYNPLHTDETWVRENTPFKGRIAHGLLGLCYAVGLTSRSGVMDGTVIAFLGLEWKFVAPIYPGDTIHQVMTVADKRATSKPGRGIVGFEVKVYKQNGELVQEGKRTLMMKMKGAGGSA